MGSGSSTGPIFCAKIVWLLHGPMLVRGSDRVDAAQHHQVVDDPAVESLQSSEFRVYSSLQTANRLS